MSDRASVRSIIIQGWEQCYMKSVEKVKIHGKITPTHPLTIYKEPVFGIISRGHFWPKSEEFVESAEDSDPWLIDYQYHSSKRIS